MAPIWLVFCLRVCSTSKLHLLVEVLNGTAGIILENLAIIVLHKFDWRDDGISFLHVSDEQNGGLSGVWYDMICLGGHELVIECIKDTLASCLVDVVG
jgi:hypothetical protein